MMHGLGLQFLLTIGLHNGDCVVDSINEMTPVLLWHFDNTRDLLIWYHFQSLQSSHTLLSYSVVSNSFCKVRL